MTQQRLNRIPLSVVAAISAAVLAAGGGATWWAWNSSSPPTTPPPTSQSTVEPSPLPPPPVQASQEQTAQVYWLKDTGTRLELAPQQVTIAAEQSKAISQPDGVLKAAFTRLLEGPTERAVSSTIPEGTKLRSLTVKDDGIHVDLSSEFTSGGGSASMTGRVAQVIYTATSLQPKAKVWIDVDGKPLEVLGGEGLELEQPVTRQHFEQNFML